MDALPLDRLCSWLKHRLVTSKQSYCLNTSTTDSRVRPCEESQRQPGQHGGRKRKISWEILHPLKHRRLEREERVPVKTVEGNFNLEEINGSMFPGEQSTATSMCAILRAQTSDPLSWTSDVIDKVLLQGDRLHTVRLCNLEKVPYDKRTLSPDELPENIAMNKNEYKLKLTNVMSGNEENNNEKHHKSSVNFQKFHEQIKCCVKNSHSGVLLTKKKNTTSAIFTDGTDIYLFNPKKKSSHIFTGTKYRPVLSKFRDVTHLTTYLQHVFVTLDDVCMWRVDLEVDCHTWTHLSVLPDNPWV